MVSSTSENEDTTLSPNTGNTNPWTQHYIPEYLNPQLLCSHAYALFYCTVNVPDYTASGVRMIGRDVEGSGLSLVWKTIPFFARMNWRNPRKPQIIHSPGWDFNMDPTNKKDKQCVNYMFTTFGDI